MGSPTEESPLHQPRQLAGDHSETAGDVPAERLQYVVLPGGDREKINGFDEDYILPAIGEDIDPYVAVPGHGLFVVLRS